MFDGLLDRSDALECLVDFLGKIGQVLGTHIPDDRFLLVGQSKRLAEIAVRQGAFRFAEQGCAELVADDRGREQPVQAGAFGRGPSEAAG